MFRGLRVPWRCRLKRGVGAQPARSFRASMAVGLGAGGDAWLKRVVIAQCNCRSSLLVAVFLPRLAEGASLRPLVLQKGIVSTRPWWLSAVFCSKRQLVPGKWFRRLTIIVTARSWIEFFMYAFPLSLLLVVLLLCTNVLRYHCPPAKARGAVLHRCVEFVHMTLRLEARVRRTKSPPQNLHLVLKSSTYITPTTIDSSSVWRCPEKIFDDVECFFFCVQPTCLLLLV